LKEDTLSAGSAAPATDEAPRARARRRGRALWLGLGGAAVTVAYGVGVMHVREGAPLVMLALGGLTLVLSGIALWRVLDPLSRAGLDAAVGAPSSGGRRKELEREKRFVLKAIKEIELDYQMRKIGEADYKEMVERYRGRALRVMSELEAGDNFKPLIERELRDRLALAESKPAAAAAAATGLCKSCATQNDEDAQFCKKCGAKISSS